MLDEKNKMVEEDNDTTFSSMSECEEKIEKLNKKLQDTANELEEISRLYAKSVKEGLDKSKRIKELEDKIDELEEELKKCKAKRDELEKQLKDCQEKNKELEKSKDNKNVEICEENEKVNVIITIPIIKNGIYCITEDDNDNIYCVGRSKKVFKVKKNKDVEIIGELDAYSRAIKYDGLESIYIGTNNGTIYKYNIKTEKLSEIEHYEEDIVTIIETDNNHNTYIGTWDRYTGRDVLGSGRIYKIEVGSNSLSKLGGTSGAVWALAVDDNNIYVGTTKGLFKSDVQKWFTKCPENIPFEGVNIRTIRSIIIDKDESIWIGTREKQHLGHIYRCKKGENKFTRIEEKNNGEVFALAIDSKQSIYAGTWNDNGIGFFLQYCSSTNSFATLTNIPTNLGSVDDIFISKNDDIYIGTRLGPHSEDDGRLYKMRKICM